MSDDNLYIPIQSLGTGGQANVFLVIHKELGYKRALRRITEYVDENGKRRPIKINDKSDPIYKKFENECKTLLRLGNGNHPNILRISQPILYQNAPAVEMDLLTGVDVYRDLDSKGGCYTIEKTIKLLLDISSALAYCHFEISNFCINPSIGFDHKEVEFKDGNYVPKNQECQKKLIEKYKVVHNDIQSKNIFLTTRGDFVLIDFGLSFDEGNGVRTSHGAGVEMYKAPEKFDVSKFKPTEQSDIYSFGILLYECLTGDVPFPDLKNPSEKEAAELQNKRKRINNDLIPEMWLRRKDFFVLQESNNSGKSDIPVWLEKIILKCLEIDPNNRFQNGKELFDEVKRCLAEEERNKISTKEKDAYEKTINDYIATFRDLKKQIESLEKKIFDLENPAIDITEEAAIRIEELLRQIKVLEQKVEEQKKGIEELNTWYEKSLKKVEELNGDLINKEEVIKNKNLVIEKLNNEIINYKIQISKYETAISELNHEILIEKKKLKEKELELAEEKKNVKVVLSDKAVEELKNAKKKFRNSLLTGVAISFLLSSGSTWFIMDQKKENTSSEQEATAVVDSTLYTNTNPIDSIETKIEENTVRVISYQEALDKVNNIQNIFDNGNLPNTNEIKEITKIYPDLLNKVEDIFNNKISILKNGGVPYGEYENRLMEIKKSGKKNRIPRKI